MTAGRELSGTQLFLRYAWPCARYRLDKGLISKRDFNDLKSMVLLGSMPNQDFLERCFPLAVRGLKQFFMEQTGWTPLSGMWSLEIVREYWRNHHVHIESPTRLGMITRMSQQVVFVAVGDRNLGTINFYSLELRLGDEVYIHQNTVVEKK